MSNLLQNKPFAKKSLVYFILTLIFISISVVYEVGGQKNIRPQKITSSFQNSFLEAEAILEQYLDSLSKIQCLHSNVKIDSFLAATPEYKYQLSFFKFQHDSMVYWSDHSVPLSETPVKTFTGHHILTLPNGIYFYSDTSINEYRIAGLFLIKQSYPYQNEYLESTYQDGFNIPEEVLISPDEATHNIYDSHLHFICSLEFPAHLSSAANKDIIFLILYALAFIALCAALYYLYNHLRSFFRKDLLFVLAFSVDVVIVRALMFIFKFPASLYNTTYFTPGSFAASDFIPSLGDFLFNAISILCIAYILYDTFKNASFIKKRTLPQKYFLIFSLFLHIFIFYRLFTWASASLILDASYTLNLNRFFFLSTDSFVALITFTILLFSFFLVSYRVLGLALQYCMLSSRKYFSIFFVVVLLYMSYCLILHDCSYTLFIPLILYIVVFFFISKNPEGRKGIGFTEAVVYLFLFSVLSTTILIHYNGKKETEQRKMLAINLASGEDPLSEYILQSVCDEMKNDSLLIKLLSAAPYALDNEDWAIQYIEEAYLADRLRKYEWMVTICTPERALILQREEDTVNCLQYFNGLFRDICLPGLSDQLYRYENEAGMSNYISVQDFVLNADLDTVYVFIELYSFFIPEEGLGYPELLIDEKIRTFSGLENYSYARYKDGNLVFKYGDYPYRTSVSIYHQDSSEVFFSHNKSDHYIYEIDSQEHIIISKAQTGYLEIIAPLSYLLIFFILFLLAFLFLQNIPFKRLQLDLNFRNRLQLYIISLIVISFAIVGYITVSYVISLNTNKNKEILKEKTHSVLIELEHKLAGEEDLNADMEEYLTGLLIKFSQVFFSDINLYDLNGRLLASSRPQIFQKQLISTRMNTPAFHSLAINKKLLFIHTETIGDQDYFSAYVPFMNADGQVIAYLNLPYFARQTELQSEISSFLNAFLNVYVLMTAIAIFIAVLISRFTTRPLQLIRDKMRSLSLGGTNEKINWTRNDEIGTLISEYNRMVDELSKSAELLAKSERESAWREMAKQVAHEIKNPLTPMKLSVQYLQKAWDEKSDDWEVRLERFSKTIIEHIDTLSDIASEFSDFAKMPQKKEVKVELGETIQKSLDLFTDIENIHFSLTESSDEPHYVLADKNQLIRVFNNLIKNSVQAIGSRRGGLLEVAIEQQDELYFIRVKDNGPGIPAEMMDKIFSPSFTTKSSGMGLGLALVRSIILEAGGDINFKSSSTGTEFIIQLPIYS